MNTALYLTNETSSKFDHTESNFTMAYSSHTTTPNFGEGIQSTSIYPESNITEHVDNQTTVASFSNVTTHFENDRMTSVNQTVTSAVINMTLYLTNEISSKFDHTESNFTMAYSNHTTTTPNFIERNQSTTIYPESNITEHVDNQTTVASLSNITTHFENDTMTSV